MFGRATRRALLESTLGGLAGYFLGEYAVDGRNDVLDTVGEFRTASLPQIPAGPPPTYAWTIGPGSADWNAVAALSSETVAVITDDATVRVVDLGTGDLLGTYDAADAARQPPEAEIQDGLVYTSIGGTQMIVGFDRRTGDSVAFAADDDGDLYDIKVTSSHLYAQTTEAGYGFERTGGDPVLSLPPEFSLHAGETYFTASDDTEGRIRFFTPDGTEIAAVNPFGDSSEVFLAFDTDPYFVRVSNLGDDTREDVVYFAATDAVGVDRYAVVTSDRIEVRSREELIECVNSLVDTVDAYLTDDRKRFLVRAVVDDGEILFTVDFEQDAVVRTPVFVGTAATADRVVAANDDRLLAVDRADGSTAWERQFDRQITAIDTVDETVYVGLANAGRDTLSVAMVHPEDGVIDRSVETDLIGFDRADDAWGRPNRTYLFDVGPETGPGEGKVVAIDSEATDDSPTTLDVAVEGDVAVVGETDTRVILAADRGVYVCDATTGRLLERLPPDANLESVTSLVRSGTDETPAVVAAGTVTDDDGDLFAVTDGTPAVVRISGDRLGGPLRSVHVYRERLLVATGSRSAAPSDPDTLSLFDGAGNRLGQYRSVSEWTYPGTTPPIVAIEHEQEDAVSILRRNGTLAHVEDLTRLIDISHHTAVAIVEGPEGVVAYDRRSLDRRWHVPGDVGVTLVAADRVYLSGARSVCVHPRDGTVLYRLDERGSEIHPVAQDWPFSDPVSVDGPAVLTGSFGVAQVAPYGPLVRQTLQRGRRRPDGAVGSPGGSESLVSLAEAALDRGNPVAAQSAAAAAYARTRSPPPGRGLRTVSRAIRIAIARPFGYHEAIRRADAAAVDGDVATAWRALADAEGALADGRRVLAVGGLLLGVGVSFPIARRVERAREPGRQKLAAEAAIRRAGVACANGHPDGHAVDRFSQSIAAFEDGAYGRAADIAKEAATAAEREQDLLETLADRSDATVDVITLYDPTPAMDRILEAIATTADATDDTDAVMTATSEAFETLEDRLDEGLMPDDGPEALAGSLPDSMSIDGASGDSDGSGGGDDPERPTSADPSKSDGAMNSDHPDGRRKQSGDQMDDRPHDGRDRSGAGDSDDETRRDDGGEVAGSPTEAASTDGDDAGDRPPAAHEDLIKAVNDAIREGDYDEARTQLTEVDQSDASIDSPASE